MAAVGGGEGGVGCAGDAKDGSAEQRAAGVELARVGLGEGFAGEVHGEERASSGFAHRRRRLPSAIAARFFSRLLSPASDSRSAASLAKVVTVFLCEDSLIRCGKISR